MKNNKNFLKINPDVRNEHTGGDAVYNDRFLYSTPGREKFIADLGANLKGGTDPIHEAVRKASHSASAFASSAAAIGTEAALNTGYESNVLELLGKGMEGKFPPAVITGVLTPLLYSKPGVEPALSAYLNDPITVATLFAIAKDPSYSPEYKEIVALHYLALSKYEGGFNSKATLSISSAKGQLGFLVRSQRDVLDMYKSQKNLQLPTEVTDTIDKYLLAKGFVHGRPIRSVNRRFKDDPSYDPSKDADYYLASTTLIKYNLTVLIPSQWSYSTGSWKCKRNTTIGRYLEQNYAPYLNSKYVGEQTLLTAYHINGGGLLGLSALAHEAPSNRYRKDSDYFAKLQALNGFGAFVLARSVNVISSATT